MGNIIGTNENVNTNLGSVIEINTDNSVSLVETNFKWDRRDVYELLGNDSLKDISNTVFKCPKCGENFSQDEMNNIRIGSIERYNEIIYLYKDLIGDIHSVEIFNELWKYANEIENNKKKAEGYIRQICTKTNIDFYIKLYQTPYKGLTYGDLRDRRYHYEVWHNNQDIMQQLRKERKLAKEKWEKEEEERRERERQREEEERLERERRLNIYINLCGEVKEVENDEDYRVRITDYTPDLVVRKVEYRSNTPGEWKFVENDPDFTVKFVGNAEDFTIRFI